MPACLAWHIEGLDGDCEVVFEPCIFQLLLEESGLRVEVLDEECFGVHLCEMKRRGDDCGE